MKELVWDKPESLRNNKNSFCPGCGHGVVQRVLCEVIDELDLREKTIAVAPVGCAVCSYDFFNFDTSEAAHGRVPAVATGIKRVHPNKIVIGYQGDGDLASIGMAETIHTANRGENITIIFINNNNYGMTGGQMAPTTMIDQKTTTTPFGRDPKTEGYPIRMAELIAQLDAVRFSLRTTVADIKGIIGTKKAIKRALSLQVNGGGYSFIEVLSNCNTNWRMTPIDANAYILSEVVKVFPLGIFKDTIAKEEIKVRKRELFFPVSEARGFSPRAS
jgi:2-oxoglutarate ferredoxin oxidoreductase subunit beta